MKCRSVLEKLSLYVDEALDQRESAQVESHLAACPECRREFHAMRLLADTARAVAHAEPPAGLNQMILEAVRAEQRSSVSCETVRELCSAFVDGELALAERAGIEFHLSLCSRCAAETRATALIAQAASAIPQAEVPAGLKDRIACGIKRSRRASIFGRISGFLASPRRLRWAAGAAAAAVIAGAVMLTTPETRQPVNNVAVEKVSPSEVALPSKPVGSTPGLEIAASAPTSPVLAPTEGPRRTRRVLQARSSAQSEYHSASLPAAPKSPIATDSTPTDTADLSQQETEIVAAVETVDSIEETSAPAPVRAAVAPAPEIKTEGNRAPEPVLVRVASAPAIEDDGYEEWFARVKDQAAMRSAARRGVGVSVFSARF